MSIIESIAIVFLFMLVLIWHIANSSYKVLEMILKELKFQNDEIRKSKSVL